MGASAHEFQGASCPCIATGKMPVVLTAGTAVLLNASRGHYKRACRCHPAVSHHTVLLVLKVLYVLSASPCTR